MSQLKLFLLGAPRVELAQQTIDLPRRKVLAILVYLAVTRQRQRRDTLAAIFWPESEKKAARAALRRELHTLNNAIGPQWFDTTRNDIGLNQDIDISTDVTAFRQYLAQCDDHGHASDDVCDRCPDPLSAALALYQGGFLAGFTLSDCPEFDDWQFFESEGLRREFANLLQKLIRFHHASNKFDSAIDYAHRWLMLDALDESVHRELMKLYALAGQQAAALRQYEECVRILDEEIGVPPEDETTELSEAIRSRRFPLPSKQNENPSPTLPFVPTPAVKTESLPSSHQNRISQPIPLLLWGGKKNWSRCANYWLTRLIVVFSRWWGREALAKRDWQSKHS